MDDREPTTAATASARASQAWNCQGCGYRLDGLPTSSGAVRCPECGRSAIARACTCDRCGYSLDGLTPSAGGMVRCPECGRKAIAGATPSRKPVRLGRYFALAIAAGLLALLPVAIDRAALAIVGGGPGRAGVLLLYSPIFIVGALLIIAAFAAFAVGPPGSPAWRRWLMALATILTGLCVGALCWFAALLYFVMHSDV